MPCSQFELLLHWMVSLGTAEPSQSFGRDLHEQRYCGEILMLELNAFLLVCTMGVSYLGSSNFSSLLNQDNFSSKDMKISFTNYFIAACQGTYVCH